MSKVVHFEIPAENPEQSMKFYKEAFGWQFNKMGDAPYWIATTGDEKSPGINGAIMKRNHPQQPLTNHIYVPDLDSAIKKVESLGGRIVVPKTVVPGVGAYAFFTDPDNVILGLWHQDEKAK